MATLSKSDLGTMLREAEANRRFVIRAACFVLAMWLACQAAFAHAYFGMVIPQLPLTAVLMTLCVVLDRILSVGVALVVAGILPLSFHAARLRRLSLVAAKSSKESIPVEPLASPTAAWLRTLFVGTAGLWVILTICSETPADAIAMFVQTRYGVTTHTGPVAGWVSAPWSALHHILPIAFVIYVAWLIADVSLEARRERTLLTAWLAPLEPAE